MSWGAVAGAAVGVVGGAMANKKSGGAGQTYSSTNTPWKKLQPYLLGETTRTLKQGVKPTFETKKTWVTDPVTGEGYYQTKKVQNNPDSDYVTTTTPGLYPETGELYDRAGWSPEMQSAADAQKTAIQARSGDVSQVRGLAGEVFAGKYDPSIDPVSQISPTAAWSALGGANPAGALSQMMSGQVDTSTLDPVIANASRRMTDQFNEQVMPGILSGAQSAGQYGGSRQGVAEGLAAKGLAQSIGDMSANLNNQAYQAAQQRMYGTANGMATLGMNAAQANADIQFQNNGQEMQRAAQVLNTRNTGAGLLGTANNWQDANYQQMQGLLDAPNAYDWNNLSNYSGVIQNNSLGLGSTTSTKPTYSNTAANVVGGVTTGLGLWNKFGSGNTGGGSAGFSSSGYSDLGSGLTLGSNWNANTSGFNW